MHISIGKRMMGLAAFIFVALGLATWADEPQALDSAQVVAKLQNRLQQAQGLSLEVEFRPAKGNPIMAKIMAMRPSYYRVETENQSFYCDGTSAWQYWYLKAVYAPFWKTDQGMHIPFAPGFAMYSPVPQYKPDYKGVEEVVFEGKRVITLVEEPKDNPNLRVQIFIDPETWLPVGSEQKMLDDVFVYVYRNVQIDRHFSQADFAWAPPKGVVDITKNTTDGPKPPQVSEIAPDFNLPLINGKYIGLSDALKGKKALLINFWFIHCGYCLMEMHEFVDLYQSVKDLEIIAINDIDTPDEIQRFVQKPNYPFPIAIDEGALVAEAYKLKGWGRPITFLILPDRTIAYVQIGYDTENKLAKLEEELIKLGIIQKTPNK